VLWLWWQGSGFPDLPVLWRAYVRRFDCEHTIRFAKQTLGWTMPRMRHPEQADRWTWLVLAAYTQLRLAKTVMLISDCRGNDPAHRAGLAPTECAAWFPQLRCAIGSPTKSPKPCGRSPGRPTGSRTGPARRYPAIKKAA
jgi:hypothetical protein